MSYSDSTLKRLSILSGNKCAFPDCPIPLIDESGILTGEICHIKAKNSGGKRYDKDQTNGERNDYENLILMCPIHHTVIDSSEDIFTVEVLQRIKNNHEAQKIEFSDTRKLEILIEKLHSIIDKDSVQVSDSSKLLEESNSSLIKARKLAQKKNHDLRRQTWFHSNDGYNDVINSVKEIFSLIEQRIEDERETFENLGITLTSEKLYRKVHTDDFGCVVELRGYKNNSLNNSASKINLLIFLFEKYPNPFQGRDDIKDIRRIILNPDLEIDRQVIWKNDKNSSKNFTAEDVREELFNLLLEQIGKPGNKSREEKFIERFEGKNQDEFDDDDFMNGW